MLSDISEPKEREGEEPAAQEVDPQAQVLENSPDEMKDQEVVQEEPEQEDLVLDDDILDDSEYPPEEYERMMKMYEETLKKMEEGQVVTGTVLGVKENSVIIDVGFKAEGIVLLDEFKGVESIDVGDRVDVYLEKLEDQDGMMVFSKKKADFLMVWDTIKDAYDKGETVNGKITRRIKGGVVVDLLGVDAFLPGSQIALRKVSNLDELLGKELPFKIIKLNKRRRNIVVSRRVILEEERESQRKQLLTELEINQVREGVVKNITDFGAFIDLGGVDGLLHITDMSWGRVSHPSEMVRIGDTIKVKILELDMDKGRISLGLKQLTPYPWEEIEKKYPVGTRIKGKVVSLTNYGAFVELEKGVEGLIHISEMSWTQHIKHPSKILAIGDTVEAVVLNVDQKDEKISLGMKQTEEDPWLGLPEKYPPGTRLEGKVRNLTSFGAFIEIEAGIDGLVHISDMSWTKRVIHPSEVVKKGDKVEVVILNIDVENKRLSLGLKQVTEDPWEQLSENYKSGVETEGVIAKVLEKGLIVDLGNDVEGFVPISQIEIPSQKPLSQLFKAGDTVQLRVLECNAENRRIVLQSISPPPVREEEPEEAEEKVPSEEEVKAEEIQPAADEPDESQDSGEESVEEPVEESGEQSEEELTEEPSTVDEEEKETEG
jgi:small subunit ribosomal protein S1